MLPESTPKDDISQSVQEKFECICSDLNIDEESKDAALESYVAMNKKYMLEV